MMRRALLFFVLFFGVFVHANEKGRLNLDLKEQISLDRALDYVKSQYDLNGSFSFREIRNYTDDLGIQHVSYQQYYNDILVENGMVMFHAKKNKVYYINGSIMTQDDMPNVNVNSTRAENAESPVLLKYADEYVMCYKRNDYANHRIVFISKENGDTIKTLSTAYDLMGKGLTMYNGMQDIEVELLSSGNYSLVDAKRKILTCSAGEIEEFPKSESVEDYCNKSIPYTSPTSVFNGMIAEISITEVNGDWWYSVIDTKPDLYIKIFDATGNLIYKTDVVDDNMTASWNLGSKGIYIDENYYIEIYDEDVDSDDFGNLIKLTNTAPNEYKWKTTNTSGTIKLEASPAIDVHWGMQKVIDFYEEKLNRKSYDNKGAIVFQFVDSYAYTKNHNELNSSALTREDGSSFIIYGLGDGKIANPHASLDIIGHEFTHLVIRYSVIKDGSVYNDGLEYENESGALNESFADIMGTAIEFYVKGNNANWTIGEDFMIAYDKMRSLKEPKSGYCPQKDVLAKLKGFDSFADIPIDTFEKYKKYFEPIGQQPDTYKGEFWMPSVDEPNEENDKGGVHTNSGVQNYWFYLLSEGGSGINDNGDTYDVTGIGIESAYKIAYRNLTTYLLPNATFKDAMHGSLKATIDLFGKDSKEYESVLMAWHAVGVKDDGDSVDQTPSDKLKFNAYSDNGQLIVNAPEGSLINVYGMAGQEIFRLVSDGNITYVNPRGTSIVVVKVDGQSQKIIIK